MARASVCRRIGRAHRAIWHTMDGTLAWDVETTVQASGPQSFRIGVKDPQQGPLSLSAITMNRREAADLRAALDAFLSNPVKEPT